MSDTKEQAENAGKIDSLPMTIHAQYIKDLSFENPGTPNSLQAGQGAAKTGVSFGMDARKLEGKGDEYMYEVVLTVHAETRREDKPVFITEIVYGSMVSIQKDVPEDRHHAMLLIEIPRLSFPFVRQLVCDLSMQGGYPPMMLQPVNFHKLYMDRFAKELAESKEAAKN